MAVQIDPEGYEKAALLDFMGDLAGKTVLEIGCGSGRLTQLYAHLAAHTIGIDPNADRITKAKQNLPLHLFGRVDYHVATIEAYQPPHCFDRILFSWSL
ncbi:MAG: class I SAM-dependent methyltransferase [Ardenticatenaceae bacterium]|nr:class I SAM-dependent methyltransferase [Ardenticatenaceae bacterium]